MVDFGSGAPRAFAFGRALGAGKGVEVSLPAASNVASSTNCASAAL